MKIKLVSASYKYYPSCYHISKNLPITRVLVYNKVGRGRERGVDFADTQGR